MAEFKISQFRYTWKGPWVTGTSYKRDDVVTVGGSSYVCLITHTAQADFYSDLYFRPEGFTEDTPRWVAMTIGTFAWTGPWESGTKYNLGDVALQGGNLWICINDHTSDTYFDTNITDWEIYAQAATYRENWTADTRYGIGDIINYGGNLYRCVRGHTSGSIPQGIEIGDNDTVDDSTYETWEIYHAGVEWKGNWLVNTKYKVDELVLYRGSVLRCIDEHVSDATAFEDQFWTVEFYGSDYNQIWNAATYYGIGSVVRHGGWLWYATRASYGKLPTESIYSALAVEDYWQVLSKTDSFKGEWTTGTGYKPGDIVRKGGNLYRCLLDTSPDNSSLDYLDDTNWELVIPGQNWRKEWSADRTYFPGDLVIFEGDIYECNYAHDSSNENFPGDNGSGFAYWDIVIEAYLKQGMQSVGDLLTYGFSRTRVGDGSSAVADGSTKGLTGVRIGEYSQLLTVGQDDVLQYEYFGLDVRQFFVAPDGVDDTTDSQRGISIYKPWRTIRFACEQANDGFTGTTKVSVAAGVYEEVLPIIVPARTAVVGAELRTTTVKPKPANPALSGDYTYTIVALQRVSTAIPFVLTGGTFAKTVSNPLSIVGARKEITYIAQRFDPITNEEYFETVNEVVDAVGSIEASASIEVLIADIINYLNFHLGSGDTNPTVSGTNDPVTDEFYTDSVLLLEANKDFLAEEAVAYVKSQFSSYSFDEDSCKRDIRAWVDAFKHDIIYTGNYRTLLGARYYRNAVLGSEGEDMFYCRDATGLRNMTLKDLTGVLNPPGVFDLYRRPLGGAFASLDPGWGPDHEECWINTRSPYIQGVTTFGTACVGQKIDGNLHNGGNKSMVSNDFTQVLSDGIGAWVLNNGRAELVSVFTYYCAIGYLAEQGGVIRATNGNCSYGRYGAISDGVDPSEVPARVTVNNRNNEATVASTFAGEFNDEIYAFEYSNCGQNYTAANATIIGSGIGASVQYDDFRDNAIFQCRLLDTSTSLAQTIGGSGYSIAQNNAQPNISAEADLVSIVLASNDPNEEDDYLGKRIIITGGTGTGQYGYITAYNTSTKVVSISRESDDQPGWDHIFPGTPPKAPLDTTTFYRIEPRVIFSEPEYSATEIIVPASTEWGSMAYGETYASYTGVASTFSEGDDSTLSPFGATFDVVKYGREYAVTIRATGSGYSIGDLLIISGEDVGGTSPRNDIEIRVTAATDDSTKSIVSFTSSGTAATGVFVALTLGGTAGTYSYDGETWPDTFNMPSSGDWNCLAAVSEVGQSALGSNVRFVAIKKGSGNAASSFDGITWTARSIASRQWNDVVYGEGKFVAVSGNNNQGAYSTNGTTWTLMSMPTFGDSATNEWVSVAYGKGKFLAIANSNNVFAISENGISWTAGIMDVIADSSSRDWVSVAYGNNRFVAISSTGDVGYSFDGELWLPATMPTQDGSTTHVWKKIKYAQGVFFAIGDTGGKDVGDDPTTGPTTFAATSADGIVWTPRTLASEQEWTTLAFGNPYNELEDSSAGKNTPIWVLAGKTDVFNKVRTGCRALGRVTIGGGVVGQIKIWDPGSGYQDNPSIQVVDPNVGTDVTVELRTADGVLSQPSWIDRGTGYRTVSTRVTITGNGFADVIPAGKFVTVDGLDFYPGPGAQIIFDGNEERYTVVALTELGYLYDEYSGLSAYLRLSPDLKVRDQLEHGTFATLRSQYSQCRITGHDFLDIGSGNFEETNYPELYSGLYSSAPENEVYEEDGGRVFYTSTDQSGNFRCGELFAVEQATGIVTISADFFDFSGLTELRLGGIRVGGTGAIIREFSTDPTFTEDSNNIVPTQRAISSYLANRLSVGGSEIATASFIAGLVRVGPDLMRNTLGGKVLVPVRADFEGAGPDVLGGAVGVRGSIVAQAMFLRTEDEF